MTLPIQNKKKIIAALLEYRKNYDGSDQRVPEIFNLHASAFSQLKAGRTDGLVSDDKLVAIGVKLGVTLTDSPEWKIANTQSFDAYTELMRICQKESMSRIICDKSDRGKTTAAKQYMLKNKNVFYVDCSQCKTLRLFIRALAKCMGLSTDVSLNELVVRIKYFLNATDKPLVVLDEFGDLKYDPFLEMKAMWNGTEARCGWVVIGAQGLRKKIENGIKNDRVGFEEFYRRFGNDFMTATEAGNEADEKLFFMAEAEVIVKLNMPGKKVNDLLPRRENRHVIYSLTRIKERIIKLKGEAA